MEDSLAGAGCDVRDGEMAQALRQAGYRLTQPRLAVLRVLELSGEELSPLGIYERGRAIYDRLGLVTVYRTLEILDELGVARRVHTHGRCRGYARAEGDQHYLVCRRCGTITGFPCEGLDPLIANVQGRTGYTVDAHLLELTGLCPECQRAR
jgi:Fur family transcriptional regulator, ferric uptake regulator